MYPTAIGVGVEPDPAAITRQPGDAEGFHRLERRIFPLDDLTPDV